MIRELEGRTFVQGWYHSHDPTSRFSFASKSTLAMALSGRRPASAAVSATRTAFISAPGPRLRPRPLAGAARRSRRPHPSAAFGFVEVRTRFGVKLSYWVVFDEPQRDGDGDGPYREAEVLERHLRPLG